MKGNVSTKDIILKGLIEVDKNLNLETLQANENKTYNVPEGVDGWDEVVVNVPSEEITIESKSITENGTYNAPVGVAGYNPITVDVQPDLEDIKITENGTYTPTAGKDGFSEVEVDVDPNLQILEADTNGTFYPTEGKDGFSYAIVDVPTERAVVVSKTVTANGTYNVPTGVDGYNPVIVNVPQSGAVIESKSITENGTYTPAEGVDGFAPVVVNVNSSEPTVDELTTSINHNGTFNLTKNKPYGVDYYDPVIVTVNVPERVPVIESKSITENGTYTAPTGVDGYSPITVNVQLPSNAYLLKELSNLPQPIASFNDGADAVMQSIKVDIVPVQSGSGDPSPTNVRPISGWTEEDIWVSGKNWCPTAIADNIEYIAGDYGTNLSFNNGVITYNLTITASTYFLLKAFTITKQHVGKTFTMSYSASPSLDDAQCILVLYDGTNRTNLDKTVTITDEMVGKDLTLRFYKYGSGTYTISNIQLEEGTTATNYEPYAGTTTTIPFTDSQGNPVEVFGGSVDVVNGGEQPNTMAKYDLNTLTWTKTDVEGNPCFYANLSDGKVASTFNGLCSTYKRTEDTAMSENETIQFYGSERFGFSRVMIRDDNYASVTASEFKSTVTGNIIYELATPTTFYTQPTSIKSLDGENNVFASTGDVTECEYFTPVQ